MLASAAVESLLLLPLLKARVEDERRLAVAPLLPATTSVRCRAMPATHLGLELYGLQQSAVAAELARCFAVESLGKRRRCIAREIDDRGTVSKTEVKVDSEKMWSTLSHQSFTGWKVLKSR